MEKVTIYDIAKLSGTNITAVSRAFREDAKISQKKRDLILKVAEEHGYRPNPVAGSLSRKSISIGVVYFYSVPDYCDEQVEAIQKKAAELADFKVSTEILCCKNEDQIREAFDYFLEKKVQGVLTNALPESDFVRPAIDELERNGIRVALFNADLPESDRTLCVSVNLKSAARAAADLLRLFGAGREVAVFAGGKGYTHNILTQSFCERAASFHMKVSGVYFTQDDPEKAAALAREVLSSRPRLSGIYISSANSIPVLKELVMAGKAHKIRVVASDVFPGLASFLREGTVDATIYQSPALQAESALEYLYRAVLSGVKEKKQHYVLPEIVVAGNLGLYEKRNPDEILA